MEPPYSPHPDDPYWKRWIAEHGAETWRDLGVLVDRDPDRAHVILRDLVSCACTPTHAALINLGRFGVLAMSRPWVLANLRPILDDVIADGDDWDYRRALELASFLDLELVRELVIRGERSEDPHVREAADDWR